MRRDATLRMARTVTLLAALALSAGGCTTLDNVMVSIFGRSMRDQPSFDPYENPRLPAEHSVPFASGNYPAELGQVMVGQPEGLARDIPPFTPQDMAAPGSDVVNGLENPVPATEASLARGDTLFHRYCAVCHGPEGFPAQAPMAEMMQVVQAFPLAVGNATTYTDGYIYGMIRAGRGVMPSYGHRIPHFDRWHIVNYVRHLQELAASGATPTADGTGGAVGAAGPSADSAAAGGEG